MKNIILLLIISLTVLHMQAQVKTTPKPKPKPKPKPVQTAPKKANPNAKKSFTVSGKVEHTYSYCGGARPSPEMLAEYQTPKPFGGKKFYVRKGKVNTT